MNSLKKHILSLSTVKFPGLFKATAKDGNGASQNIVSCPGGEGNDSAPALAGIVLLLLGINFLILSLTWWEGKETLILAILCVLGALGVFFLLSVFTGTVSMVNSAHRSLSLEPSLAGRYLASLPQAVIVTNLEGKFIYANRAFGKMTGLETGAVHSSSSKRIARDFPVETLFSDYPGAAGAIYRLARAGQKGQNWTEEFRLSTGTGGKSGGRKADSCCLRDGWYRINVRRLFLGGQEPGADTEGEGALVVWEISELTAERHRQEKTFQDMQHIINYFDHAPAGFFTANSAGQIDYMNKTLSAILGYDDPGEVSSRLQSVRDFFQGDKDILFSRRVQEQDGDIIAPGKTLHHDVDVVHKDGHRIPVRLMQQFHMDEDDRVLYSRNIVLFRGGHISETLDHVPLQGWMESAFKRLYEASPIAVATIGKGGVISDANAHFLRMFSRAVKDFTIGRTRLSQIVNKDARDQVTEALEKVASPQIEPIDIRFRSAEQAEADIRQRNARLFVSPTDKAVEDLATADEIAFIFVIDMTEQMDLEAQMAQGQKMAALGQFAGGIAHDFNNVLQAIIGFSDLLLGNHTPESNSFKDIIAIKNNASRAAGLVRQILAFSRGQTLRPSVLDLNSVLRDLENVIRLNDKVVLEIDLGRDLWEVKADRVQLEQVILNLSKNAMDAMPHGGTLSIRTSNTYAGENQARELPGMQTGEFILIEVSDTGCGMPPDVIEKIFEPFFTTKDVGKGTGLGLSSVYGIIKQTGGYIYPLSEEGVGTTFSIYLPRLTAEDLKETGPAEVQTKEEKTEWEEGEASATALLGPVDEPSDVTGTGRILLVEDEDAVRAFSERALADRGYEMIVAADGEEGLELFEEYNGEIDLVISDVMMPVMDGPTLIAELKQRNPDLKAILMSGWAEDQARQQVMDDLGVEFMHKPFPLKKLAQTVKKVMKS